MNSDWIRRTGVLLVACLAVGSAPARAQDDLLSAEAVRADLRLAVQTIETRHPDLAHSVRRQDLDRAAAGIERRLRGPMTRTQAWSAVAQLNPVLADGHLFIGIPDWRDEVRRRQAEGPGAFPFEVAVGSHAQLTIVSALGGTPTPFVGRRILRINGRRAVQVVHDLLARVHGDTPAMREAILSQRWWFFYASVFGAPATFRVDMDHGGRQSVPASRAAPVMLAQEASFERTYRCEVDKRGAVLTVGSFAWPDKARFYGFTHACFARMAAAGADRLVIDVRRNGGGDDDMWREGLLRYIADRPYRHGSAYVKRVEAGAVSQSSGEIVRGTIETEAAPPSPEPLRFAGKVYVLVGPMTYSSTVLFANVVQDYGFGEVAGVGKAVRTRQSGGVQTFRLPRTGLILYYPRFVLDRPSGAAAPACVEPDIPLADDPLHEDAAVDALLERAAHPRRQNRQPRRRPLITP